MGACSERPEVQAARNTSYEWYSNASAYTAEKYKATKDYLGPKITKFNEDNAPRYDIARMYANGWIIESVTDETQIKFITEFEKDLPLRNISLTEFERRLKKLVTPAMNDMVPVRVVIECFKDHWAFPDITEEESLSRELMFDTLFLESLSEDEAAETDLENRRCSIPMLMLLGLLYCRSNRRQRAEKFYELVEIQLTESLQVDDVEFRAYVPFLYEIAYKLMFRLYCRHRDQTPGDGTTPARCPEIDFREYTPSSQRADEHIRSSFTKRFIQELFVNKSRMTRKNMEDKVTNQIYNWLQPYHIRSVAYDKFNSTEA